MSILTIITSKDDPAIGVPYAINFAKINSIAFSMNVPFGTEDAPNEKEFYFISE